MTKKYEQKTKQSSLTTSQETFQQEHGNGSYNTDSATDTGNRIAAILKANKGSLSQSVNLSTFLSDVMFPFPQKILNQGASGLSGETVIRNHTYLDLLNHLSLSASKTLSPPTKSDKQDT